VLAAAGLHATGIALPRQQVLRLPHGATISSAVFSSDGRTLATADDRGTVRLWDPETGRLTRSLALGNAGELFFAADGKSLIGTSETARGLLLVRGWDATTGRPLWSRTLPKEAANRAFAVALSPDGRILATIGVDDTEDEPYGVLSVWSLQTERTGRPLWRARHLRSVAFSPDGKLLAGGGDDGDVRIWNLETGKLVRRLARGHDDIDAVAFSPDGKYLASAGGDVRVWDARTCRLTRTLAGDGLPELLLFSRDGQYLMAGFAASMDESVPKVVRRWDLRTGRLERKLRFPPESWLHGITPDGQVVATSTLEGSRVIRLWHTP
jgi:WD40 repeat protein